MSLKNFAIMKAAHFTARAVQKWKETAVDDQMKVMTGLVRKASHTVFGKEHHFNQIKTYEDYKNAVPIRDYEDFRSYIDRIIHGEQDVLWQGRPKYFAKTSGTTSGIKYIPITKESMPNHILTARTALLNYFHQIGNANVFNGKVIFLSGSPELEFKGGIPTGRLSGIVNHEVPKWVRTNQLPSYSTNCIEDWEQKLDKIVDETIHQDMTLISGIPPWVQMYYEKILERSGKSTVHEVFPNYSLFMYGGVNFEPYRTKLESLVGRKINSIETFPASEGFMAFQDDVNDEGLLLNTKSGIFFEFVPVEQIGWPDAERIHLAEVELGRDYVVIINSNAGLWGYNIGDCVRFVQLNPYKLIVSGRVKHYISAFGEHVIGKEVEAAILEANQNSKVEIIEFTVAPQVNPSNGGLPFHEWFVEFDKVPSDLDRFAAQVNDAMCRQNIYYDDLIKGKILQPLIIRPLKSGAFRDMMKAQGKLGGQNKVPRLSNDRKLADQLCDYIL
ncbi:MAG: GH3 auxin-responsive promoter family protein [Saprospiraceae bacterium]|nr:MAG: GH3 auxin-responsive promoter [Bacteroidetes bacterium OLB9]MCO6462632.1 GH3 auxin-responsive promoter family protein [Saprospiraceae bacterium]